MRIPWPWEALAHTTARPILFWIFIPIFLLISFIGHYFIYFSLTRYFDLSGNDNIWLGGVLFILSLSFLGTTVFAHYYDNKRTRYSYFLASLWLWFGLYLVFFFAVIWVFALIIGNLDIFIPMNFFGIMAIGASSIISLYGFYHATHIHITRIRVPIQNLPHEWEGKKVIHISDIHLGHILRARFLKRIVRKINQEDGEIVCITGDLFDGMDGSLEHLIDPLDQIEAPKGILYVDWNHEAYLGIERALKIVSKTKTKILHDEIYTLDGLDFIWIDYTGEKRKLSEVIMSIPWYSRNKPTILLYHVPEQIDEIVKTGVDLELCGHTHRGQLWPSCYISRLLFRGRDYGLHTIGNYSLNVSSGVWTWWPPMRVGSKAEIVVIELTSC